MIKSLLGSLVFSGILLVQSSCSSHPVEMNFPGAEDGLLFETPSMTWDEGLPLGNGIMGALVWGDGSPLRLSLDRSDLWDLRPVPEFQGPEYDFQQMRQWHIEGREADLMRVYEEPYRRPAPTKIPAGRIEFRFEPSSRFSQARLDLLRALARVDFQDGTNAEFLVHAEQPVGHIQIRSVHPPRVELIAPGFGGTVLDPAAGGIAAGDLAQLGYPAPVRSSGPNWQSYLQEGHDGFHYAVHLEWRSNGTDWMAAWSVASSFEGPDPASLSRERVRKALDSEPGAARNSHENWWRSYWERSSVQLPNPLLERQWFLEQYKFGSAARRGAPPISLQAVWTADNGKLPPWKGDYHHDLHTQLSYWPCCSGNHLEEGLGYLEWLWDTRESAFDWTSRFFKLPGLNVPMTVDLEGKPIGGWRQYTTSATTAAWLAHHFYLHWKYSADRQFLEDRAYPYLRDSCIFLEAFTENRDASGLRTFPLSSSPEINDNRPEAWFPVATNYDLALTRWLFAAAVELAEELGLDDDALRWTQVLSELPELSVTAEEGLLVGPGYPLEDSHRHFSHLMAIHPLGLIDLEDGERAHRIIGDSLAHLEDKGTGRWTGYSFSWLANILARSRDGLHAEKALEIFSTAFTLRNSFHCNGDQSGKGYSRLTYRPFTLEGNFAAAAAIQEMLLQSHRDTIRIFPAIPDSWQDVSFKNLRAQGAFLVSALRKGGEVRRLEIVSENGGACRFVSPFTGREQVIATQPGQLIVME